MPGSPSASFIPKHSANKPERRNTPRQVFFGTLIVRVLFIATLIAALGVFLYLRKVNNELMVEVTNFNAAASVYEADADKLEAVLAMDKRLLMAKSIFTENVSINSLLTAIERSVIGVAQVDSLEITVDETGQLNLLATVKTDSFDSTIFQRSVLKDNEVLGNVTIKDVVVGTEKNTLEEDVEEDMLTFKASVVVDPESIPALLVSDSSFIPVSETASSTLGEGSTTTEAQTDTESTIEVGFGN